MTFPEVTSDEYRRHMARAANVSGVQLATSRIPAEHDIIVNGIRLHYLDWGGDGQVLIFLHGGGLHAHSWDLIAQAFANTFRCLALDQRGHGKSEWSSTMDYRPSDYAADCSELVRELSLVDPVLVGTSMGGVNALAYATSEPNRPKGLILLDVSLDSGPNAGRAEIRSFMTGEVEAESLDAMVAMGVEFNHRRRPELLSTTIKWNSSQLPNGKWTWRYDRRHRQRDDIWSVIVSSREDLIGALPSIKCPVLVARGERSRVVSPEDVRFLAERIPACTTVEVPDAGHSVHGDNPRETVRLIRLFLEANHLFGS